MWPPETRTPESNLTGTGGSPSFGFSITLIRECFFHATLRTAFNQLGREVR